MSYQHHTFTTNRANLTARESIEVMTQIARKQDQKMFVRKNRVVKAGLLVNLLVITPPICYTLYHMTVGYWRQIYPTHVFSAFLESANGRARQYFVPQIYLKERQKRKIQIKLKDTEELREAWNKKKE